jgi:hypothetical protein
VGEAICRSGKFAMLDGPRKIAKARKFEQRPLLRTLLLLMPGRIRQYQMHPIP